MAEISPGRCAERQIRQGIRQTFDEHRYADEGVSAFRWARRKLTTAGGVFRRGLSRRSSGNWSCPFTTELVYFLKSSCLLYTSDAADDLTRVDLGGRRII